MNNMTLEERIKKAQHLDLNGFNCCQSVVNSLSDQVNVDDEELRRIASGFAIGMGNMSGTCGALVGAIMIAGLNQEGTLRPSVARKIVERFKELSGATICKDLKTMTNGKPLCSCLDCIKNAIIAYHEVIGIKGI